jgi:dihydrofolate reductase
MASRAGNVIAQASMSLDGFIAAPQDDMDWVFEHVTPEQVPEMMRATGAMLSGRRSYEVGERDVGKPSGEAYGGAWHGPMFVLTHRPPAGGRPGVTFLSGDIAGAVATAREAAGGKDLVVLGANVVAQCLQAGLVDELQVLMLPVMLGGGTRLYSPAGAARVDLDLVSCSRSGQVSALRFRVRGPAR